MLRSLFLIFFAFNILMALVFWALVPEPVAVHYGAGGHPDGWASSTVNLILFVFIAVLIFSPIYFAPTLLRRTPSRWLSLPHKKRWLSDDGRERLVHMMMPFLWEFGLALFLFFLLTQLLTLEANLSDPVRLRDDFFLVMLVVFLTYTVCWTVRLITNLKRGEPG